MFQVGDSVELVCEDSESRRGDVPIGSTGIVAYIDPIYVRVIWDDPVPIQYPLSSSVNNCMEEYAHKEVYGVFTESLALATVGPPQPHRRICRKIKQMDERWNKFQQGKQQCAA